jgi:hypothetical protein
MTTINRDNNTGLLNVNPDPTKTGITVNSSVSIYGDLSVNGTLSGSAITGLVSSGSVQSVISGALHPRSCRESCVRDFRRKENPTCRSPRAYMKA